MQVRFSATVWVALALILVGPVWAASWTVWSATRIWDPLDVSISVAPGHIRVPEFRITAAEDYALGVVFDNSIPEATDLSEFEARWALSQKGKVLARGSSEGNRNRFSWRYWSRELGQFHASSGTYALDVDIVKGAPGLDVFKPRLGIAASGGAAAQANHLADMGEGSFWILCPLGMVLLIRAGIWRLEKVDRTARANALTQPLPRFQAPPLAVATPHLRPRPPKYRHRRLGSLYLPAFTKVSSTALVMVLTYVAVDIPVWALHFQAHPGSRGLPARLWHPQAPTTEFAQSIVVRLALTHRQLSIDGQPVTRENFENELRKKLTTRQPNCPIYFQGDPALEWQDAATVIDMIRKLGGNVIL